MGTVMTRHLTLNMSSMTLFLLLSTKSMKREIGRAYEVIEKLWKTKAHQRQIVTRQARGTPTLAGFLPPVRIHDTITILGSVSPPDGNMHQKSTRNFNS